MTAEGFELQTGLAQMMIKVEGTHLKMPLSIVTGGRPGPTIFITTGLHGCEYPGTLAAIELLRDLDPAMVSGRIIALHPVNTQAFRARMAMILPEDGGDLNAVFPGRPDGSASEKVAWRITEFQDMADFCLDLHSGDLHEDLIPFVYLPASGERETLAAARQAAAVVHVPYMAVIPGPGAAINSAARRGTPALLIERGGAGACHRTDVEMFKKDMVNVFRHLGLLAGQPECLEKKPMELADVIYVKSEHNGLWRCEVKAGDKVLAGQTLGEVCDYFGEVQAVYRAERDGVILCRFQSLSINAGDFLAAY